LTHHARARDSWRKENSMNGFNVNERRLIANEGYEGPAHDPYGWNERTVILNGHRLTYRQGALGYHRLIVDGRKLWEGNEHRLEPHAGREPSIAEDCWLRLTGFRSVEQFDRAYMRAHEPCYDYEPDTYYGHA
jgi:hypothetical protein